MKLHFDELKDTTKESSAIYEFFTEEVYDKPLNINKIKGKSLAQLIKERKLSRHYRVKKSLKLKLQLLQILVILAIILCFSVIIYLLFRLV